ncbi:MAG TPA: dihydropteroate synthase [Dongiaceae bacterium]|nr:dihydropteroate synthase [Dongiaceae bacterium]
MTNAPARGGEAARDAAGGSASAPVRDQPTRGPAVWRCRDRALSLERPLVMGVINVTPDSFSDGGRFLEPEAALAHARRLLDEGADLLDLGAESTRPGAEPVPADEQWRRLSPVLEGLARETRAVISVDTSSAAVAERVLAAGAHAINDVSALGDPEMGGAVAGSGAGLVLMHMRGTPATMQRDPRYDDVVAEVAGFLAARRDAARAAGIADDAIVLDPGIGFGKTVEHNLALLGRIEALAALGAPVLIGVSRKRFLGALAGDLPADERLEAGLAAAAIAVRNGAAIVRTHDVEPTVRALRVAFAIRMAGAHDTGT